MSSLPRLHRHCAEHALDSQQRVPYLQRLNQYAGTVSNSSEGRVEQDTDDNHGYPTFQADERISRRRMNNTTGEGGGAPLQLAGPVATDMVDASYSALYSLPLWNNSLPRGTRFVDWRVCHLRGART